MVDETNRAIGAQSANHGLPDITNSSARWAVVVEGRIEERYESRMIAEDRVREFDEQHIQARIVDAGESA